MTNNKSIIKKSIITIISVLVLVFIDQLTKNYALAYLKNDKPFIIFNNILELLYVENTGAAFGMMKSFNFIFYILPPAVSVFLIFMILRIQLIRKYYPLLLCFIMVISGALGNFIDRLKYGYVVDFIYFMPIDFPVFNVADIYVTCSCILLIFLFLFVYKEDDLKF